MDDLARIGPVHTWPAASAQVTAAFQVFVFRPWDKCYFVYQLYLLLPGRPLLAVPA
jgi:hypothetical protein